MDKYVALVLVVLYLLYRLVGALVFEMASYLVSPVEVVATVLVAVVAVEIVSVLEPVVTPAELVTFVAFE